MISKKLSPYFLILACAVFLFTGIAMNKPVPAAEPEIENSNHLHQPLEVKDTLTEHPAQSYFTKSEAGTKADSLIKYAKTHLGTPYVYGAEGSKAFDCSGFTTYIYRKFDIEIPHSSAMQAHEGYNVQKEKARRGDLIVFTGTNASIRKPGHVGIIISKTGSPIRFVHASSAGGVKISELEGTRYSTRFLGIRRLL